MERRVLLAIFLCFLVLYVWQALIVKPPAAAGGDAAAQSDCAAASGGACQRARRPPRDARQPPAGATPPATPPRRRRRPRSSATRASATSASKPRDVIAVFTNRGARLKSWRLKHYLDQQKEPQELVATSLPRRAAAVHAARGRRAAATATLNSALYTVSGAPASGQLNAPGRSHVRVSRQRRPSRAEAFSLRSKVVHRHVPGERH